MNPYIQIVYGPTGYRVEKWVWNSDADEYVLDEICPERFEHYYQAEMLAASWSAATKIKYIK